ncbi:hypothetical protein FA13DRAFT_1708625 [Coprinellus micaceus]|uniref:Uncharacterized protein n=1 Tax=Coprinellus micaceus TaxID=71717 RepID=A0A4Y7TGH8_COPMI|nr:hypothetical protein FA13DRAFT_1708625 [Coprinellus micaceus]
MSLAFPQLLPVQPPQPRSIPPFSVQSLPQLKIVQKLCILSNSYPSIFTVLEFYRKHKGNFRERLVRANKLVTWDAIRTVMKESWLALPLHFKNRYITHGFVTAWLLLVDATFRPYIPETPEEDQSGLLTIVGEIYHEPTLPDLNAERYSDEHIHEQFSAPQPVRVFWDSFPLPELPFPIYPVRSSLYPIVKTGDSDLGHMLD